MDEELKKLVIESESSGTLSDDFEDSIVQEMPCISDELVIGIVGNVDSGKSTTVGVLVTGQLDDGRGSARSHVQYCEHERRTGRTSTVSSNYIRTEQKVIEFVDLPGHRRYLRTTMHGLAGRQPDFVLVMVGANMGVSQQSKEHLEIAASLRIPFIVVITKVDIAPKKVLKDTYNSVVKMIKKGRTSQNIISCFKKEMTEDDSDKVINYMSTETHRMCPIILLSNKTGLNVASLRRIILGLTPRFTINIDSDQLFNVTARYRVHGVGTVVTGRVIKGIMKPGDKLFVGPLRGEWTPVVIKSLHNNFREFVDELSPGQSGCLAIKSTKKKVKLADIRFKKGVIVANYQTMNREFIAKVAILRNNYTSMKIGYQPVINCGSIVQAASIQEILESPNKAVVRGGDQAVVRFRFVFRHEHLNVGDRFIFREGNTKGVGIIQELITDG